MMPVTHKLDAIIANKGYAAISVTFTYFLLICSYTFDHLKIEWFDTKCSMFYVVYYILV